MVAVLVIGTGRSGTSLLMQALGALGMQIPKDAVPATENNLRGTGEDIAVRDQMLSLHAALGSVIAFRPDGWEHESASRQTVEWIADYLAENQAHAGANGFAVKFPLTALYLPLWQEASRRADVPLKMLWATRSAPQTVRSLIRSYGTKLEGASRTWAQRTYYILRDAPSDTLLLPYQAWAENPKGLVHSVADFVGITDAPDTSAVAARQFSSVLDHSADGSFEIAEPACGIASSVDQLIAGQRRRLHEIVRRDDIDFVRLMTRLADAILALAPGAVPVAEETEMRTSLLNALGDEANQETSEMKEEIAILTQRIRQVSAENYDLKKELAFHHENPAQANDKTKGIGADTALDPKSLSDIHQELLAARWKLHELQMENEAYRSKLQRYEEELQKYQTNLDEKEQSLKTLNDEFERACSARAAMKTEATEIREAYARLALQRDGQEEEIESRYHAKFSRLEKQISTLKYQRDSLRNQQNKLKENNEKLRVDRDAAKRQREEFHQRITELPAEGEKARWPRPASWIPSLPKRTHSVASEEGSLRQDTRDKQTSSQTGVSILVRAGSNKQAAQKFLQQLVKMNTFKPTEVILLFDQAQANHLQLEKDFARKLPLRILSAKGRTFASLMPELYYDQTLILTLPLDWHADLLPKAAEQLRESGAGHLALKAPDHALLVKTEAMTFFAERFLMAPANVLHESLAKKTKG